METIRPPFGPHANRLLRFGIAYPDLLAAAASSNDWDAWSLALEAIGDRYRDRLDTALRAGRSATAAEAGRLASAYYHFAQFKLVEGPSGRKAHLRMRSRDAYRAAAGHCRPPARRMALPFDGVELVGYFREAGRRAPCVILINGLDSCKEVELHGFGEVFLQRGMSTFTLDGPGQGECRPGRPLLPGFEEAVSALIDFLQEGPAPAATGVLGVSLGGHLAPRAAAADPRIAGCISLGGFFDSSPLSALPPAALSALRAACGLDPAGGAEQLAHLVDLGPLRGALDRPLLIVHGGADHLVSREQAEALASWSAGPTELWSLPASEHVCADRFDECLPAMGDWMMKVLRDAEPSRRGGARRGGVLYRRGRGASRPVLVDLSRTLEPMPGEPLPVEIVRVNHEAGAAQMSALFGIPLDDLPDRLGWAGEEVRLSTHSGTHMDAPWHYGPSCAGAPSRTIDQVPLEWCFGPAIRLDFSRKPHGFEVRPQDIEEAMDGLPVDLGSIRIVLIQSGADPHWGTPDYPRRGVGLGREAILFLCDQGVRVVGTDAWGIDRPFEAMIAEYRRTGDPGAIWPAHFAGREREYCQLEKLANLHHLPPCGFTVACFPVRLRCGSAGWTRAVALLDDPGG